MTPDGQNISNMTLSTLGALPLAAEELDMEAYPILSCKDSSKATKVLSLWVAENLCKGYQWQHLSL
jgi:hypothetical protein